MKKFKCDICGFIAVGEEAPDVCAVCGVSGEHFSEYTPAEGDEKLWLCLYCGFIYEAAEAPRVCPECQAVREAFVEFKRGTTQFKDAGEMWKCKACGHVEPGSNPPTNCPRCEASEESFLSRSAWLKQRAKR